MTTRVGSMAWSSRTHGELSRAERRELLRPLARAHLQNVAGRAAMALHVNSGRRANIAEHALRVPSSVLTRAAEEQAERHLTSVLLRHSHRCYLFGVALADLEQIDVDRELLFAAALLHDIGLTAPRSGVDFSLDSSRVARDVAETVGLSTAATHILRSAITLHHTPGVTLADGPVPYLMSTGHALDVIGLRAWQLPPRTLTAILDEHPRRGFTDEFRAAWAAEADAVPHGRAQLLRRYGALDLAIRLAPLPG